MNDTSQPRNTPGSSGTQPLVSVVVSAFNQEKYIAACIASCLNQQEYPVEVIVVDGGSHDRTLAIVRERWPDISVIELPEVAAMAKQGRSGNALLRNTGWRRARGEYLVFIDGDDELLPEKLARQVPLLQARPELGFVYGNLHYFRDAIGRCGFTSEVMPTLSGNVYREVLLHPLALVHAILFPRHVLEAVGGFDESLIVSSDWQIELEITRRYPVLYVDVPVGIYRLHGGGISRRKGLMARGNVHILERLLDQPGAVPDDMRAAMALEIAYAQYLINDNDACRQWLARAAREPQHWRDRLKRLQFGLLCGRIDPDRYCRWKDMFRRRNGYDKY